jgi:hypothetical protein
MTPEAFLVVLVLVSGLLSLFFVLWFISAMQSIRDYLKEITRLLGDQIDA